MFQPQTVLVWDAELGYSTAAIESRPDGGPIAFTTPDTGANPMWGVWMTNPSGGVGIAVIPHARLEWCSAAYGMDPDDLDTLMDVILHEPCIPDPGQATADPASLAILQATVGLPTWSTPGVPDAERRAAYLERVRLVKDYRVRVEPAPQAERQGALTFVGSLRTAAPDPLSAIKEARLDPVRVAGKRMRLDWERENSVRAVQATYDLKPPLTFVGAATTGEAA